jgi:malic enzyme
MVPLERIEQGAIYPRLTELRTISREIAVAVAREARDSGVAPMATDSELEAAIDACIWAPQYECLEPTRQQDAAAD